MMLLVKFSYWDERVMDWVRTAAGRLSFVRCAEQIHVHAQAARG